MIRKKNNKNTLFRRGSAVLYVQQALTAVTDSSRTVSASEQISKIFTNFNIINKIYHKPLFSVSRFAI